MAGLGASPKEEEFFTKAKTELNLKIVREYCGHGIGRVFHEEPQVLHYGKPNSGVVLEEGMTLTIEPMQTDVKSAVDMAVDTIEYLSSNGKNVFFDAEHFFDGYKANPGYAIESSI